MRVCPAYHLWIQESTQIRSHFVPGQNVLSLNKEISQPTHSFAVWNGMHHTRFQCTLAGSAALSPKKSMSKFCMNSNLSLINTTTKAENWPMPNILSEPRNFWNRKYFASLDVCDWYWQRPSDNESNGAYGIKAVQGSFPAMQVLHGLKIAAAYFLSTQSPLFPSIWHLFKLCIGEFILHTRTEQGLHQKLNRLIPYVQSPSFSYRRRCFASIQRRCDGVYAWLINNGTKWTLNTSIPCRLRKPHYPPTY